MRAIVRQRVRKIKCARCADIANDRIHAALVHDRCLHRGVPQGWSVSQPDSQQHSDGLCAQLTHIDHTHSLIPSDDVVITSPIPSRPKCMEPVLVRDTAETGPLSIEIISPLDSQALSPLANMAIERRELLTTHGPCSTLLPWRKLQTSSNTCMELMGMVRATIEVMVIVVGRLRATFVVMVMGVDVSDGILHLVGSRQHLIRLMIPSMVWPASPQVHMRSK